MGIGRLVMAILMGEAVTAARKHPVQDDEDWLAYLIERMLRGAPTAQRFVEGNSGVGFVTFNFDTVIEDRLRKELQAVYRNLGIRTRHLNLDEAMKAGSDQDAEVARISGTHSQIAKQRRPKERETDGPARRGSHVTGTLSQQIDLRGRSRRLVVREQTLAR